MKVREAPKATPGLSVAGDGSANDHDTSMRFYIHGAAAVRVGDNVRLGADARVPTGTDITLFGVNGDADYKQFSVFIGFAR